MMPFWNKLQKIVRNVGEKEANLALKFSGLLMSRHFVLCSHFSIKQGQFFDPSSLRLALVKIWLFVVAIIFLIMIMIKLLVPSLKKCITKQAKKMRKNATINNFSLVQTFKKTTAALDERSYNYTWPWHLVTAKRYIYFLLGYSPTTFCRKANFHLFYLNVLVSGNWICVKCAAAAQKFDTFLHGN